MQLSSITKGVTHRPPIIGVSGPPGIGKTTFAASAPSPIILPTEDGSNELDVARFPLAKSYSDILAAIKELGTQPHEFKTLVLDSLDHAEPLVWAHTCEEGGKKTIEAFGYGKGYVEAVYHWRVIFDGLKKLREKRGMGIILISHVQVKKFEDPGSDGYDRFVPKLHKEAANLAIEECDAWGFANYETKVIDTNKEERKRAVGQGNRIIWWSERPSHLAKNRYNLPDSMPLEWATFAAALKELRTKTTPTDSAMLNVETNPAPRE